MKVLAKFDGYTLREADSITDLETLAAWIEADETHRGIFAPQHFLSGALAADPRPGCYALEDATGEVVFFIRLSRAARVQIQFPPEADRDSSRTLRGLLHGMAFLEVELAQAGCEEWIFDTMNPQLKKTAERLLGFTESTHEMVRAISRPGEKREVEVQ